MILFNFKFGVKKLAFCASDEFNMKNLIIKTLKFLDKDEVFRWVLLILTGIYVWVRWVKLDDIAEEKTKIASNIQEDCAYVVSASPQKHRWILSIGSRSSFKGYEVDSITKIPKTFPFFKKRGEFYTSLHHDDKTCHKVKYIRINWIIVRRTYIYDII